ncbi:MAG: hypothetical protein J0L78_02070 [Planctomycetes bacterium]|nr:hypothetical protein [Planctomycetota bacterium]
MKLTIQSAGRVLAIALLCVLLAPFENAQATLPLDFSFDTDGEGSMDAGGQGGLVSVSVGARKVSAGGSTGGGFVYATMNAEAEIIVLDSVTLLQIRYTSDRAGASWGYMTLDLEIDIPRRVAYNVDEGGESSQISWSASTPGGINPWIEPGRLSVQCNFTCEPGHSSTWTMALADDHRVLDYRSDFMGPPTSDGWAYSSFRVQSASTGNDAQGFYVNGIVPTTPNSGGPWSELRYTRTIPALSDFNLYVLYRYCSHVSCTGSPVQAMQNAYVRLLDSEGMTIAEGGFNDAWVAQYGNVLVTTASQSALSGVGSLGANGSGNVSFSRFGPTLHASAFSSPRTVSLSEILPRPVHAVQLVFAFWPGFYPPHGASTLGFMRFDYLELSGARSCLADNTLDNTVDDEDFVNFVAGYDVLDCNAFAMAPGCPADIDQNGVVDDADFVLFALAYNDLICP